MDKKRNRCMDAVKGAAAICVILIHVKWGGKIGDFIAEFASWAVPFFFMVSGYFAHNANRKKVYRSICHILKLVGIAYAINLLRIYIENSCSIVQTGYYLVDMILSWRHFLMWLVLNTTFVSGVAWFLFALLDCYIIVFIFYKQYHSKTIYYVAVLGFGLGICSKIILPMIGYHSISINNVWMCGLPYFITGTIIHRRENLMIAVKERNLFIAMLLGILMKTIDFVTTASVGYIGDIIFVLAVFIFALKKPQIGNRILANMGSKYAFYIYIMHPIFMHVFDAFYQDQSGIVLGVVRPLTVIALSVCSAFVFFKIKEMCKRLLSRGSEND